MIEKNLYIHHPFASEANTAEYGCYIFPVFSLSHVYVSDQLNELIKLLMA